MRVALIEGAGAASIIPKIEDMRSSSCAADAAGRYALIEGAMAGGGGFGLVLLLLASPLVFFFAEGWSQQGTSVE